MNNIPTPQKKTILKHFEDAQEIKDLRSGMKIDIGLANEPKLIEGAWYFGQLMIWQFGKYAEITKTKSGKCPCKKCKCDKKKDETDKL